MKFRQVEGILAINSDHAADLRRGKGEHAGMEYKLTRSKRKTVSLSIDRDLTVVVRAPMRMPRRDIDHFVVKHEDWLAKHLTRLSAEAACRQAFRFADGDRLPLRGETVTLAAGGGRSTCLEGAELRLPPAADREKAVAEFLRKEARAWVTERIAFYAPRMGVEPTGLKITSAATRWGSCNGRNSLCFSYRVACLPQALLDYIVVHELAHIREHNHSDRFWAEVGRFMPDYAERRAQLRAFQKRIPF